MVKASASRAEDLSSILAFPVKFCPGRVIPCSDLKTDTPVTTLPGTWRCGISTGTGWPGVSILLLGEIESFLSKFCLSPRVRACGRACEREREKERGGETGRERERVCGGGGGC